MACQYIVANINVNKDECANGLVAERWASGDHFRAEDYFLTQLSKRPDRVCGEGIVIIINIMQRPPSVNITVDTRRKGEENESFSRLGFRGHSEALRSGADEKGTACKLDWVFC